MSQGKDERRREILSKLMENDASVDLTLDESDSDIRSRCVGGVLNRAALISSSSKCLMCLSPSILKRTTLVVTQLAHPFAPHSLSSLMRAAARDEFRRNDEPEEYSVRARARARETILKRTFLVLAGVCAQIARGACADAPPPQNLFVLCFGRT